MLIGLDKLLGGLASSAVQAQGISDGTASQLREFYAKQPVLKGFQSPRVVLAQIEIELSGSVVQPNSFNNEDHKGHVVQSLLTELESLIHLHKESGSDSKSSLFSRHTDSHNDLLDDVKGILETAFSSGLNISTLKQFLLSKLLQTIGNHIKGKPDELSVQIQSAIQHSFDAQQESQSTEDTNDSGLCIRLNDGDTKSDFSPNTSLKITYYATESGNFESPVVEQDHQPLKAI